MKAAEMFKRSQLRADIPEFRPGDIIRTVHGHGYQFIATLVEDALPPAETPEPKSSSSMLPRLFAAAFAITLIAFI